MYDLFVIVNDNIRWKNFKERFPHARRTEPTSSVILDCARQSYTSMFWFVDYEYNLDYDWDFSYNPDPFDQKFIHTWQAYNVTNGDASNSYPVKLIPRQLILDNKDCIDDLFEVGGHIKPMDQKICHIPLYDLFYIWNQDFIDDELWKRILFKFPHAQRIQGTESVYKDIAKQSTTDMFWVVEPGYVINADWDFTYTAPIWDRGYIHTWAGIDSLTNKPTGQYPIKLVPKELILETKTDINELFESIGYIKPMNEQIAIKELHDLFFIWDNVDLVNNDSIWNAITDKFPHAQRIQGTESVYKDIALISSTDMFYAVEPTFAFTSSWDFTYTAPIWDRTYIHTWQAYSQNNAELGIYPIKLIPKNTILSYDGDIDDLFTNSGYIKPMTEKVVYTEIFDIFFVSYNEPNADKNWQILSQRFPRAQRVHGIVGIDNAHRECAKLATTNMFWTVDADTIVDDTFTFDYIPSLYDRNYIHIWYSRNPINGLEYGYGAVKLWPKSQVETYDGSWLDYTVSVGQVKIMNQVVATTAFNSSPFETWKSAFRECIKLMRNIDHNPQDTESKERFQKWCEIKGDAEFSNYCIKGATDAIKWYKQNKENLYLINNFNWLEETYKNFSEKLE
jgi:hypothetical protein